MLYLGSSTLSMVTEPLPLHVVLEIIYHCDVSTLKSLRLASRSTLELIDNYQVSICSHAFTHFYNANDVGRFQILDDTKIPLLRLLAFDYRLRTAKWLAAVGMENMVEEDPGFHVGIYGNVGANESQGDPMRDYITAGWGVLWRLADIARSAVLKATHIDDTSNKHHISSLTRGFQSYEKLESSIKLEQMEYMNSLPYRGYECYGYRQMRTTISNAFRDRVFDDPRGKNSDWRTGNEYTLCNSWLNWLVLREGPHFWNQAWSSKAGNEACVKLITREWSKRSREQILLEKAAAKEIEEVLCVLYTSEEMYRHERLMSWARGTNRQIDRVYPGIPYHLGRRLSKWVIQRMEWEYSDYSS